MVKAPLFPSNLALIDLFSAESACLSIERQEVTPEAAEEFIQVRIMKMMHGLGDEKIGSKKVHAVGLMDCELQAFRFDASIRNTKPSYRFAVIDNNKAQDYPANFVCMLPLKIEFVKGKNPNAFGVLFGEKSTYFALELLRKALLREKDGKIKTEIEKRIKLLDPKQASRIKCSDCEQIFESKRVKKYKNPLCKECYLKRFSRKC